MISRLCASIEDIDVHLDFSARYVPFINHINITAQNLRAFLRGVELGFSLRFLSNFILIRSIADT